MPATAEGRAGRWHARPLLARMCRAGALLGPVVVVAVVAYLGARFLPTGRSAPAAAGWWTAVTVVAVLGAIATEHLLRRLLTLATVLDLDIGFPSAVPSRRRVASQALNHRRDAQPGDLLPGVRDDLDTAAEHVMISYAARARAGLQPRSHLDRVRALAALVAARLGLGEPDRDRLQWALLLRELGTTWENGKGPAYPVTDWLGPWTELLHGPFIDTASYAQSDALTAAAHVTAVADAYVVVSAAHPYQRSVGSGHAGGALRSLAQHRLQREAVDALLTLPESRLRRAIGFTVGVSPLLARFAPSPQPTFALASVVVVALLAAGVGVPGAADVDDATQLAQLQVEPASTPVPEAAETPSREATARPADGPDDKAEKPAEKPEGKRAVQPEAPTRTVTYASADDASWKNPPASSSGSSSPQPRTAAKPKPSKPTPSPTPTPTPKPSPTPKPTPKPTPTPAPTPSTPPPPDPGGGESP